MTDDNALYDKRLLAVLKKVSTEGINHAVEGLSNMIGDKLSASLPEVSFVSILDVPNLIGGPENEAVGVYLRAEGKMTGQFMLILPKERALEMVDMLMGDPPGTAIELDGMGKSALAEVGNLMGSYFLNEVALITGLETKPTPPDVMFDMVGAIMNVIVATSAEIVDRVIAIRTVLMHGDREAQLYFWYVPHPKALDAFVNRVMQANG